MKSAKKTKISEIVNFNPKLSVKRGTITPFIDMASITIDLRDIPNISHREYKGGVKFKNGDTLFARITPCLENGKTAKVSGLNEEEIAHGSTEFIIMTAIDAEYDEDYIYYLARLPEFRAYAEARMEGTSGRQRVSWQSLAEFEYDFPLKIERKKIGQILCSFDDKINLNNKINQTLEQIAQTIFKSWFVDFDPVKAKAHIRKLGGDSEQCERAAQAVISGTISISNITDSSDLKALDEIIILDLKKKRAAQTEKQQKQLTETAEHFPEAFEESELGLIPKGWVIANINDVCDFQNGYAFKSKEMSKVPGNTYKVFKMGGIHKGGGLNKAATKDYYEKEKCDNLKRYLIKKGDLLMCMTDMKDKVALLAHTALMDVDDEFILNQRVGLLRTKNKIIANYPFLYILTNSKHFIEDLRSRANSGVQVNLSTKEIKETKFILPSKDVHLIFDKIAKKIQKQKFSLGAEQEHLSTIRDSLLPKLLSGELNINDKA